MPGVRYCCTVVLQYHIFIRTVCACDDTKTRRYQWLHRASGEAQGAGCCTCCTTSSTRHAMVTRITGNGTLGTKQGHRQNSTISSTRPPLTLLFTLLTLLTLYSDTIKVFNTTTIITNNKTFTLKNILGPLAIKICARIRKIKL